MLFTLTDVSCELIHWKLKGLTAVSFDNSVTLILVVSMKKEIK